MSNFFAVRAEIAKKLEEISEFKKIYTPINIGGISELSQVTPSAHVNYLRIRKADEAGRGSLNQLKQEWDVTIVERHAASQLSDGSKAIDKAGELVAQVIPLLSGWQPDSSARPLSLVRISEDFSPTCVYITLVFESSLFI
ncbi:hypothetical protein [Acinetobacter sp. ANC 4648]|uniref:phage tail terminator protein n=1 Tax=Acinetobacter sp. ANC 4648 TaxID=1977875 RepID=UPI000A33D54E|nr:hypothetical protein [Acinetobacter sp. ANC 4648]OTG79408.1 hypothetical protein B9T27_14520 [Acinetobacter sp. ANC 4648]